MRLNLFMEMSSPQTALLSEELPGEVLSILSSLCSLHSPLPTFPSRGPEYCGSKTWRG